VTTRGADQVEALSPDVDASVVLEARNVTAGYGEVEILHGVSMRVGTEEIVSVIGPNGAGKSTMMKAIFGLVRLTRGTVLLEGQDVTGLPTDRLVRQGMGYVPQVENVFPSLTVRENLEMGAFSRREGTARRMREVFELFPLLAERSGERAGRLSGGQRQLVALARALMLEPRVLLLDEPSAGLSPHMLDVVFQKVIEINAMGTAILMVEQNAKQALQVSHRTYVMATGENRLEGRSRDLLESDEVRRLYLGE
jgi:ABC-type branched-subunit amino acid transport system ATPase component